LTYRVGGGIENRKEKRLEAEKEDEWDYPTVEESRAEDREIDPAVVLTVRDDDGNVIRRVNGAAGKGFHRVAWDLRFPYEGPVSLSGNSVPYWAMPPPRPARRTGLLHRDARPEEGREIHPPRGPRVVRGLRPRHSDLRPR